MALTNEILAEEGGAPVMPVSAEHAPSQIDETEELALREKTVIQKENASATKAEQEGASAGPANDEASLLVDIGMEAVGAKTLLSAVQLVGQRIADVSETAPQQSQEAVPQKKHASNGDSIFGAILNTVQETVMGSETREPGSYRNTMATSQHAVSAAMKHPPMDIEDFLARTEITRTSLRKSEPMGMIGDKNDTVGENAEFAGTKVPNVSQARSLTAKKEMDMEQVLNSVHGARQVQQSRMKIGMDLGMGMSNGPVFRAGDIGKIEQEQKKDWWQQNMEDAKA